MPRPLCQCVSLSDRDWRNCCVVAHIDREERAVVVEFQQSAAASDDTLSVAWRLMMIPVDLEMGTRADSTIVSLN